MIPSAYASFLPTLYTLSGIIILLCGLGMAIIQLKLLSKTKERKQSDIRLLFVGIGAIIAGLTLIIVFIDTVLSGRS
jgi:hypothetical protein